MASKSDMTTKFTEVDVSRLNFTVLEENKRSKGQNISYPRYTLPENGSEVPLFIQFPWVDLKSYGVPKIGEYYSDDSQRLFVKLPLDQSVPEIKQLSDMLRQIDEKIGSEEFRLKMFGQKASKYEYQPIFRLPQEEDQYTKNDTKKNYGPKHPYMKLKIDTTFPDNEIKTIIFNSVLKEGKRVRTKVDGVKTIDDFASHVCWMSRIHPVVRPVKLWAQAPNKKDPTYGITFKIAKTEVEPPSKTSSNIKQFIESDDFLDSDEESDTVETVVLTNSPVPSAAVKGNKVVQVAFEEESDSVDPTQTKSTDNVSSATVKGKLVAQVASDDESEEDEDDEEVTKPVTKSAASKTLAKKVIESDDDEESDEEEVKPAKKSAAKSSTSKLPTASKTKKNSV